MMKAIALCFLVALSYALLVACERVDTNDEKVVAAANAVTKVLSKQFAGKYHHRLAKVLKANKQEQLGGANYQMDIVVGQTTCLKEDHEFEDTDDCDFQTHASTFKKCIVSVFRESDGTHRVGAKGCILATKKEIEGI